MTDCMIEIAGISKNTDSCTGGSEGVRTFIRAKLE